MKGQLPTAECNPTRSARRVIDSTLHKHNRDADTHSIQISPALYVTPSSLLCSQQTPIISQINPIYVLTLHFHKTDFNIILPHTSLGYDFSPLQILVFRFSLQLLFETFLPPINVSGSYTREASTLAFK
jgi:hypothetical protein